MCCAVIGITDAPVNPGKPVETQLSSPSLVGLTQRPDWWLLALLVWAHLGYTMFPHKMAAFASGLGMLTAYLLWTIRGERFSIRWFICLWGIVEGLQVFVCQGLYNWWPVSTKGGMCEAYTGWPLTWYGLWCIATLTYWLARKEQKHNL